MMLMLMLMLMIFNQQSLSYHISFKRYYIASTSSLSTSSRSSTSLSSSSSSSSSSKTNEQIELEKAMENARNCAARGLSPGAGLLTADEQSDAAYADLINTSMDQKGIQELQANELQALEKGGKMWEKGSKDKKGRFGIFSDLLSVAEALAGGAHITKNEYGET